MENLREYGKKYQSHISNHRPKMFKELLKNGELNQHLLNVQKESEEMEERLIRQCLDKGHEPIHAKQIAREIVLNNLILVPGEVE